MTMTASIFPRLMAAPLWLLLVASLTGCSLGAALGGIAAGGGMGGAVSDEWLDTQARPPKQVVYRFDEQRYIENDPNGGRIGGCQGELYYVDEALGIRTKFGYNRDKNPRGLFKVVSSYVVVRDENNTFVSFDKGRTFVRSTVSSADVGVEGANLYAGSGPTGATGKVDQAFDQDRDISLGLINEKEKRVDVIYRTAESLPKVIAAAPIYAAARALKPTQFFVCKDLPWRPSAKVEREQLAEQLKNSAKSGARP